MPWKSKNILKEIIGRWYMVDRWEAPGKYVSVLVQCKEFEENSYGTWWASFMDLEGNRYNYNQKTIRKITKFLHLVPDEKFQQYLDLFNLYGPNFKNGT